MKREPAYTAFLSRLRGSIARALCYWAAERPGRPIDAEVLTGLCERRLPTDRQGRFHINLDERLWLLGRTRHVP